MLVGYVSDERYVALPDVLLEFTEGGRSWEARSRATGAVWCDLPPATYDVALVKPGFGSKRVRMTARPGEPYSFRLLSDRLLGYAWPKCARSGERSEIRVHSVEPYKLELWRYGWDKELIRRLGWHDEHGPLATLQVTPDGDYTPTGVAWNKLGYASPAFKVFAEAPDKSGLYYFRAQTASGAEFSFPWIVAPAAARSRIAVLASNINWNAYNNFGGRSNYINADGLPPVPVVNARLELSRYAKVDFVTWSAASYAPLSFERPEPINHIDSREGITDPIEGRNACHVAPAEWRVLGWLEREGFAYDLYAETQFHRGLLDLAAYKVLILSAHPEYWTGRMYDRLKDWVFNRGGRLMYLGGNGLNCEVDLRDDETMVVHNGQIKSLWPEGIGAESRFAKRRESEAHVLGVVFTPAGMMTAAPYRVMDASHWAFAGTGLREGDLFGQRSLHMRCPGGASGHETDKVSPSSPRAVRVLAKGLNPDNGGADMIVYEVPGGGAAFSAGSICYPSSLLVDEGVSRVTANVLSRFLSTESQRSVTPL